MSQNLHSALVTHLASLEALNKQELTKRLAHHARYSPAYIDALYQEQTLALAHLKALAAQYKENPEELEAALRYFFKLRWTVLKGNSAAYVECPISPVNRACEQLAIALAKPHESIAQILMHTIEVGHYQMVDEGLINLTENEDRTLAYHKFIISHDGRAIIPLKDWVALQKGDENQPYLYHVYLTGENGSHQIDSKREGDLNYFNTFKQTELSDQDLENLKSVSPEMKAYIEGVEKWKTKAIIGPFTKTMHELYEACHTHGVNGDSEGKATELLANPKVYPFICKFLKQWLALSPEDSAKISALADPLYNQINFGDYLLVLHATALQNPDNQRDPDIPYLTEEQESLRKAKNLSTCVDLTAKGILRILHANSLALAPLLASLKNNEEKSQRKNFNAPLYEGQEEKITKQLSAYAICLNKKPIAGNKEVFKLYHEAGLIQDHLPELMENKAFALDCAIKVNDLELINQLIAAGADISQLNTRLISFAIKNKYYDFVVDLIKRGADVNKIIDLENEYTLLHIAVIEGNEQILDACLAKKDQIDINIRDKTGGTPLLYASGKNSLAIVKKLLAHGADLLIRTEKEGFNCLYNAAQQGQVEIMKELILAKVDVNAQTDQGYTPLYAAIRSNKIEAVNLLLNTDGIKINTKTNDGRSPLHVAFAERNVQVMTQLILAGADFSGKHFDKQTLLEWAINLGYSSIIAAMITKANETQLKNMMDTHHLLHLACKNGWVKVVKACLLREYVDINSTNNTLSTPLHAAAQHGHTEIVNMLLNHALFHSIDNKDSEHWTALHLAIKNGHTAVVKLLLEAGTDITVTVKDNNVKNQTALHLAARDGHEEIVKIILALNTINIEAKNDNHATALQLAFEHDPPHVGVMLMLIEAGADFSGTHYNNKTLLGWAIENKYPNLIMVSLKKEATMPKISQKNTGNKLLHLASSMPTEELLDFCLNQSIPMTIDETNNAGETPLFYAAQTGSVSHLQKLLARGADLTKPRNDGYTVLHTAARCNRVAVIEALIAAGAEVNRRDNNNRTPLHEAAELGHTAAVTALLSVPDILINQKNNQEKTPLQLALVNFHWEVAIKLITAGAEFTTEYGLNILDWAVAQKKPEVIVALIARGIDLNYNIKSLNGGMLLLNEVKILHLACQLGWENVVDACLVKKDTIDVNEKMSNCSTPLSLAAYYNHHSIVKKLIAAGANVNLVTNEGTTPLTIAVARSHVAIVRELLTASAETEVVTKTGNTPLHLAIHHRNLEIVILLLKANTTSSFLNRKDHRGNTALIYAHQYARGLTVPWFTMPFVKEIEKALILAGASLLNAYHFVYQYDHENPVDHIIAFLKQALDVKDYDLASKIIGQYKDFPGFFNCFYFAPSTTLARNLNLTCDSLLNWLIAYHPDLQLMTALLSSGFDFNHELDEAMQNHTSTTLISAVKHGRFEIAQFLIEVAKVNINEKNSLGYSALYYAIAHTDPSSVAMLEYLLAQEGIDCSATQNGRDLLEYLEDMYFIPNHARVYFSERKIVEKLELIAKKFTDLKQL